LVKRPLWRNEDYRLHDFDEREAADNSLGFAIYTSRPLVACASIWMHWTGTRGTKAEPVTSERLIFRFCTSEPNANVSLIY